MPTRTAIDRNVWQFLVTVTRSGYDPSPITDVRLREEEIAAFRHPIYGERLWITPTVQVEAEAITDPELRCANEGMRAVFLREIPARELDAAWVEARTAELGQHHSGAKDCRIVAEAEAARVGHLLTFDTCLRRRLAPHSTIPIMTPTAYWEERNIPRGTTPTWEPAVSNPLRCAFWWRW